MPKKRDSKREDSRIAVQVYLSVVYGQTQKEANGKALQVKLSMLIPNITPHWLRHTFFQIFACFSVLLY
jgi:hypothetical protein